MTKPEFFNCTTSEDIQALSSYIKKNSVDETDVVGMTALHWGALCAKDKSVSFLLNNNADVTIKDKDGITAYDWAVKQGNKKAQEMIRLKIESDQMGWPLLNWIAKEGRHSYIRSFIDENNANIVDKDFGRSCLHWAVYSSKITKDRRTLVRVLECSNVYIDLKDQCDGRTALGMAAYLNDTDTLRLLINHKPDLDARDKTSGYTPIMWGIDRKNFKIIKLLIAAGATLCKDNNDCENILKMAKETNNKDVIGVLEYCISYDRTIKKMIQMLFSVKNKEKDAEQKWQEEMQNQESQFSQLPVSAQNSLKKSFSLILKGPTLFSNNIYDQDKKLRSLTKPSKSVLPVEFLSNEEMLIKRLKSQLNKLF